MQVFQKRGLKAYFCPSMNFQKEIINWYNSNKRDLPWRHTTDAYVIWLSEIILQQTRVEQGMPYFIRFLEAFPTVADFAKATEEQVLKLWQGLGYYSRGRNMLKTAQLVVSQHSGQFPTSFNTLLKLKGIGEYTAAAIASFSSNVAHAVVDGNVYRVLSRYFGISDPINSTIGKKTFAKLAQELIQDQPAALYNQAIMEFGALQCKPKSPNCSTCPISQGCYALKHDMVGSLPLKEKKLKIKKRYFNYLIIQQDDRIVGKQRIGGDIWQNMYDFPLLETDEQTAENIPQLLEMAKETYGEAVSLTKLASLKHILTHQIIFVQFFALKNYIANFSKDNATRWYFISNFKQLPHPKVIANFLKSI